MMFYLIIYMTIISTISLVLSLYQITQTIKKLNLLKEDHQKMNPEKLYEEYKPDTFIDEIMSYALDKKLVVTLRPGINNKMTMYHRDTDGNEYSVVELFSVKGDKNSVSYQQGLKELTGKIDTFIENKQFIKDKVKEERSATNK